MKVLVLGGTGAIGHFTTRVLAERGHELVVTSRNREGMDRRIRYVRGDARDACFLAGLMDQRWDAIVDFMVYSTPEFRDRMQHILAATAQYVFLSSSRVYAESAGRITEETPRLLDTSRDSEFLATDEYSLAKARQEDALRASGLRNWTIVRPYITYADERLQLGVLEKEAWLYRAMCGRTIVFPADLWTKRTTLTYGFDVAGGIAAIVGDRNAHATTLHMTTEQVVTWGQVANLYLDVLAPHLGTRPRIKLQTMEDALDVSPGKYQLLYDRMFDRAFDNSRARRYVCVGGFAGAEGTLGDCLKRFLIRPAFRPIDWRLEAKRDRQTGERAAFREMSGVKQKIKYLLYRYGFRN